MKAWGLTAGPKQLFQLLGGCFFQCSTAKMACKQALKVMDSDEASGGSSQLRNRAAGTRQWIAKNRVMT